ncbi:MAG: GGDEF domain-containing protein [Aquificaceae bacterium]
MPLSFSLGFACYPEDGKSFEELLKIADKRMYENKKKRKQGESFGAYI